MRSAFFEGVGIDLNLGEASVGGQKVRSFGPAEEFLEEAGFWARSGIYRILLYSVVVVILTRRELTSWPVDELATNHPEPGKPVRNLAGNAV